MAEADDFRVALTRAAADLGELPIRGALVGGLAISSRARPRFTLDLDFAVAVADDREAESLVFALRQRGYDVAWALENTKFARLATVRLRVPGTTTNLDLLFASIGIESEIVEVASPLPVGDVTFPVAAVGDLIASKLLSRSSERPIDDEDLRALLAVASDLDLARARASCRRIAERGFDRGRDLLRDLDRALIERNVVREPPPGFAYRPLR